MDHDPYAEARSDPLIYVEPAPFEVVADPDWAHARVAAPSPVVVPGRCPHRLRWRDLKAVSRIVLVLVSVLVWATLPSAVLVVLFGCVMVALGIETSDMWAAVVGLVFIALAAMLVVGFAACVRVWRGLHRPGRVVCVVSTVASPLMLAFTGFLLLGEGWPWLVLLVVPPIAPMLVLWWCRAVAYSRETCVSYPWLPLRIAALRRG